MTVKVGLPPPRPQAVGLVFDKHGRPKIKDGWVERLSPEQRKFVEHALNMRGFRLTDHSFEEIDDGNSQCNGR